MAEIAEKIIESHTAPAGFVMISVTDYKKFQEWESQQRRIQHWNLKDLAHYLYGTRNTKRASEYLYHHRNRLDIECGGFIDYDRTHNGWRIPVGPMTDFVLKNGR